MVAGYAAPQSALDMLRQQGFSQVRIELSWGMVDPKTEAKFKDQPVILAFLGRLRKAGLRPLILLNANDGNPCPAISYNVQTTADAPAGSRSMTLASTTGLVPGRSGFSHVVPRSALASVLVTEINGQQASLSQPLPVEIPAGTPIEFTTLNYEPFSQPGMPGYERTLQGWLRYVDLVGRTATAALGTAGQPDRGFDLEVWNELTFGSRFLDINNYYDPKLVTGNPRDIFSELVQRTADHVSAAARDYQGVRISDGFGNTIPWPAASTEPPRISAISKHPYPRNLCFPENEQQNLEHAIVALDAFGQRTEFVPTYKAYFPEYYANAIQTESLCRDIANESNFVGRTAHGRLARTENGQSSPVDVWITEIGCSPKEQGITDPAQAARLMTTFVLRTLFFHLGIGVGRVYLFEAFGDPGGLALVDSKPSDMPSMPLICLARVLSAIRGDPRAALHTPVTPVTVQVSRSQADLSLFDGNGTPNLPPMTTADSLVLLPVQSSGNRIAIIYYIMTRDIRVPLDPQPITVSIQGKNIQNFHATFYDSFTDQYAKAGNLSTSQNKVEIELSATDMPKLLLLSAVF